MSFLRQLLMQLKEDSPKIKIYEKFDDNLEEVTINDIFWTHDCLTFEIEDMVQFALDNGYKSQ